MLVFAQISPLPCLGTWFIPSVSFITDGLFFWHIGKGGQRWINLKFIRIQPSEIMKLAVPLLLAGIIINRFTYHLEIGPIISPSSCFCHIDSKAADLNTAILILIAGASVLFLAGLSWQIILSCCLYCSLYTLCSIFCMTISVSAY